MSHAYYELIQSGYAPGSDFALHAIRARIQNDLSRADDPALVPIYASITKAMTRFITEQSPIIDRGIHVLGYEHEIDIPVTLPSGQTINLYGFVDLIYRDANGKLKIRDHKTGEKAWAKADASASNQLLFYSAAIWLQRREVPIAEISFINTREYVRKTPSLDTSFTLATVAYTEIELRNYLKQTLQLIDNMLTSEPIPHYGSRCQYCAFNTPCILERKGIDPSLIIDSNYVVVDRNAGYSRFTAKDTEDNAAGSVSY